MELANLIIDLTGAGPSTSYSASIRTYHSRSTMLQPVRSVEADCQSLL